MKKLLFSLFTILAFVACTDDADDIVPEINLETSSICFAEDGGYATISFTSADAWNASVDSNGWCSINPESGNAGRINLVVSADANSEVDDRTATVSIQSGPIKKTISISQNRKSVVGIDEEKYTVDGDGGSIEIDVTHNVDYDITIDCDWITLGKTRTLKTDNITLEVAVNETRHSRIGHITIATKNRATSQQITIVQNGCTFKIYYTSSDGQIVTQYNTDAFGAKIISNTYENSEGVITFDRKITSIENGAFAGCTSLTSIIIPDSVTSIGESAFQNCNSLTSVTASNNVTEIGILAFYGCNSLTSFYGKLASVDNRCLIINEVLNSFAPAGLTTYEIPNSVTSIGDCAFSGCSCLTSITIPNSVISIGNDAFYGCSSLTSITIPDSITSIGGGAFSNCSSLTGITIPDSVTSIGRSAFSVCSSLISITIPDSVTSIGRGAFSGCSSLTSVTIGNSVTSIGVNAFAACSRLISVTIPDSVTSIEYGAFYKCSSLTSVTIGNSVTSIGGYAFSDCSNLTSVTIGNGVTSIGDNAFGLCDNLIGIYCKPTIPPTLGALSIENPPHRKIYVPTESVDAYKAAEGWKKYADNIIGYEF